MSKLPSATKNYLLIMTGVIASTFTFAADDESNDEHTLNTNIGLVSDYRFRGIDQTFNRPAIQAGIDYTHASGLYLGNWNSSVNSGAGYPGGHLEMDFYGGYKTTINGVGLDIGALHYYYPESSLNNAYTGINTRAPSSNSNGTVKNTELYISGTFDIVTLKYSYAITDYFNMPGTKGTSYLDLSSNYDLGHGWAINGHIGYLNLKDFSYTNANGSSYNGNYTDWKVGLTKDIDGWIWGASYVGTTAQGNCTNGEYYCLSNNLSSSGAPVGNSSKDSGRGIAILSVLKTF